MTRLDDDSLHSLWLDSGAAVEPLSLAEVKSRAAMLSRAIGRRNRREYIATAFVTLIFGLYALVLPGILLKVGSLLVIAGGFIMAWQLSCRTSKPDSDAEAANVRIHYRTRLATEERMLASVGLWYIGPLVPGLVVFMAGLAAANGFDSIFGFVGFAAIPALILLGIWLLNRHAAAMLRKQIERLDAATAGVEGERE
ncbi:hypothetical protein [Sphingopyxis sp. USTB-05]|jgi:hypothetical protein|uniref:hypothetical protein n=1 Tax=Sphingopyxis sp. USTB-05 TaxID=2830667 RepID=UPI00207870A1|nr:hypothetical protein [Sphingopyxis sp. USTB-05]USI78808.1 hypothetical protein KEC45_07940 [Sphingopyxis sp. USTB-05]